VTIPKELSHALALKTEKLLASGKETDKKLIVPGTGTASHLLVSREQLPRALRIINALFLALEEKRHAVSWPKDEGARLTVSVDGEAVTFCVREATDRRKARADTRGTKTSLDGSQMGLQAHGQVAALDQQPALFLRARTRDLGGWKNSACRELHRGLHSWRQGCGCCQLQLLQGSSEKDTPSDQEVVASQMANSLKAKH